MPNTWYVDFNNGLDTNSGLSFAQRVKTLSKTATLAAPGDSVRVMGNASTSSGTATWTNNSALVTLSAAMNQLLYGDGAWTRGTTNVTCTANTTAPAPKEGANACKMVCNASFTNGKVAYWATGTLNLTTYQQITFWIQSSVALAAGTLSLKLCSDTLGATGVYTLPINVALTANTWTAVTLNNGSAFTSATSIKSISLFANTAVTSKTFVVDNVVACKAPTAANCLTLNTLISPDSSTWYPVQSINGTTVYLDEVASTASTAATGYQGSTGSTTLSLLQPTQVSTGASGSYFQTFSLSGSFGNQVTVSGGWDSVAMATQSGWTTFDGMDWTIAGTNLTGSAGFVTIDHFNFVRCSYALGVVASANSLVFSNSTCSGLAGFGITKAALSDFPKSGMTFFQCKFINGACFYVAPGCPGSTVANCTALGSSIFNINATCDGGFKNNIALAGSTAFTFDLMNDFTAYNLTGSVYSGAVTATIYGLTGGVTSAKGSEVIVYNWISGSGSINAAAGRVLLQREDNNPLNNEVRSTGNASTIGISSALSSGLAWELTLNSSIKIGTIACKSGILTTIYYYAKKTSGASSVFRVKGGRYAGVGSVGSDISTTVSSTAWMQYAVSFTPSENCVVDLFYEMTGGSGSDRAYVSGPVTVIS